MSGPELVAGGIPAAALDQHVGILGKTGAGKSYTSRLVVEWLLEQGRRVCIVDPTGVHWGVRLFEDRTGPAHDVVILGGDHGDVELDPGAGERLGEIIGKRQGAVIVDVSGLTVGERTRWFTDFADSLFRHNREPLHLVIDEAHLFVPQGRVANPQSARMLHAGNHLVSGGRSRGLRIMLLSQRPAKVHKDALTQIETLVAMRMLAPQDRKAVREWIQDVADPQLGRQVLAELPKLASGSGYVWAPEQGYLELVAFPRIRTLDTMRAPEPGDQVDELPRLDVAAVGELEAALGQGSEIVKSGRGVALRRRGNRPPAPELEQRIRELEQQAATAEASAARMRAAALQARQDLEALQRDLLGMVRELERQIVEAFANRLAELPELEAPPPPARSNGSRPAAPARPTAPPAAAREEDPLVAMARRVWPARLTWSQLCALCGRKARGGHFNRVRRELLDAGIVREAGGRVELTDPPELGDAIPADVLEEALPEPARKMFREIRAAGWCTREELADRLGMTPRGGHWNRGLAILRSNDLTLERDGRLEINPELERR